MIIDKSISHLCAVNWKDGRTAYHRAVESGDNVLLMEILTEADNSAVNIQDKHGLSPLHLACQLGRKKLVDKLVVSVLYQIFKFLKYLYPVSWYGKA